MLDRRFSASAIALCLALALRAAAQSLPAPAPDPLPASEALVRNARDLYNARRFRESAEAWKQVASTEPSLTAFAQREATRALLSGGDVASALTSLASMDSPAPAELLLRAADAARAGGLLDRAAALYRQALNAAGRTVAADEAALGLAATLEQDGKLREALETYRDLQLTFRRALAFDMATTAANRLAAQQGTNAGFDEQDYDLIVDRLRNVAAFQRAVDMLIEWKRVFPSSTKTEEIDAAIVDSLYLLRANELSRARAEEFLRKYPNGEYVHRVELTLFRLDVREGKTPGVEKRGRAIANNEIAGTTLGERQSAARLLAEYLVSVGQSGKALGIYDQLYVMTRSRGERIDILWRTSIAALRAGNRARAIKELQDILRLKPDSETERAATFWLAYAQNQAGNKTAARALWSGLVSRYPFSYYGVRAAARLETSVPEPSIAFPTLTLPDSVVAHSDYKAAALLSRAGLLPEAAAFARQLHAVFRRDNAVAILAARAAAAAGDHSTSSTLMSSYFGDYLQRPATGLPADFWTLAYPLAFWPDVSAAAARHHVDPLLMLGLARQESHFDPTARSPVGAVGLFQLMPYTAAEIDPAFTEPARLERLSDPAVSAELGAAHLAQHLARYGGAVAPTVASYNADRERVQIWWDEAKELPEELFIDSIPYRETRAYVRQVIANYAMYQRAYGTSPAAPSTPPQK